MAELVLGPLSRYVGETDATIWVETDSSCEVEVLGRRARTFHVAGHHYGIVPITGLAPGTGYQYGVALDGEQRWPEPASPFPASRIRTLNPQQGLRIAFGSCRVATQEQSPYRLEQSGEPDDLGVDVLRALALRLRHQPPERWPDLLLMLGDQVYADAASPRTRAFIRSRRSTGEPPGEEVADFEEYTRLYLESWSDPVIRWLLSTLPSAMIFDDHEVIDDWNISAAWKRDIRRQPWWKERIAGGLMSYWLYQHVGNLSPRELAEDSLYQQASALDDAGPLLHDFGVTADRTTAGSRWSYHRELGRSRLLVIDSRAGRLLQDGRREMVDDEEWGWLEGHLRGDVDHLLVATSVPFLLPRAIHDVEGWNEAVCAGAWGAAGAKLGERLRRAIDLEHWGAFRSSFDRLARTLEEVAAGERGRAPASIILLSGDVHYSYLAEADMVEPRQSKLYQVVCSPFRHPLGSALERANRFAFTLPSQRVGALLVRSARVPPPAFSWHVRRGPYFANQIATLELDGRDAGILFERAAAHEPTLAAVAEERLP